MMSGLLLRMVLSVCSFRFHNVVSITTTTTTTIREQAVAQSVEVLRYKPKGRRFDSE